MNKIEPPGIIKKLNINLFEGIDQEGYKKEKARYIADYKLYVKSTKQYHPGGFFSSGYWTGEYGHYKNNPVLGETEWNKAYPLGYASWANKQMKLSPMGEQQVIDKLNEVIEMLNKFKNKHNKSFYQKIIRDILEEIEFMPPLAASSKLTK